MTYRDMDVLSSALSTVFKNSYHRRLTNAELVGATIRVEYDYGLLMDHFVFHELPSRLRIVPETAEEFMYALRNYFVYVGEKRSWLPPNYLHGWLWSDELGRFREVILSPTGAIDYQ